MSAHGAALVWDGIDRDGWQEWMKRAGRSNLLQGWGYGAARAAISGWRVRHATINNEGRPIAVFQSLYRRLGFVQVTRLNRGPVFVADASSHDIRAAWTTIGRLGDAPRCRLLSVAPDIPLSGSGLLMMAELGYRQRSPGGWESSWLDLRPDLATLRKQLDGKWRNMLAASEKTGIILEAGSDDGLFEWMLERYREAMTEKGFSGPAVELLKHLHGHAATDERPVILRAVHEGRPVAGVCLAPHGLAATYLLGWNGLEGRSLRANQFLLWNAAIHLKNAGFHSLDLGGIDEEGTPSITAFKLGMNGERYELVGEFLKW
jgi:hypothetical protein